MMPPDAPDHELSPYTGWTRAHWERVADGMLGAVRRYASPGHALLELPGPTSIYGPRSDGLEGFARTFLAAGFRLATSNVGAIGSSRTAGTGSPATGTAGAGDAGTGAIAEWYARGLAAGTDPGSPERWPRLGEIDQAKVEAASIAIALHESRHVLWDHLDDRVRERVVDWLAESIGQPYPPCNWLWFANVVQAFLRSVGGPWSPAEVERNIAATESWYRGDGWYTDGLEQPGAPEGGGTNGQRGTGRNFDWYAGWAMHFYPLWYCRISGAHAPPEMLAKYRYRLRRYLTDVQHLYAPDGPPLYQGRSLTYRYAALAPVWAGAIFDATPLPPGRTRRLASGVLDDFHRRGMAGGLQPIGWYHELSCIRQPYSGSGSPYWSSKGFAGLVLPADHPVWTDRELQLEVERRDVELTLSVPGWLVSGTRADGVIRVVNHGTDHAADATPSLDDPGYARHAYATHAGPDHDGSMVDNHVALVDRDGEPSHRRPLRPLGVRGRVGASRHRAHWPIDTAPAFVWPPRQPRFRSGPEIVTASVLRGAVEVRLARIVEPIADDAPLVLRIGGYALADQAPPTCEVRRTGAEVRHPDEPPPIDDLPWTTAEVRHPDEPRPIDDLPGATAEVRRADGLTSLVTGLRGLPVAGVSERTGANPYGVHSATPWVASDRPAVAGLVYAAAVVLGVGAAAPTLPAVTLAGTDACAEVTVRWPDGTTDRVRLN